MTGFSLYFKVVSPPLPYSDMPSKRVFLSAMYDVQIEPTLADCLHFPFAIMTTYHSNSLFD
jgi:hypothetical protein